MTVTDDLFDGLKASDLHPRHADERALAEVVMVARTADGGSWPGLALEVTDRAALVAALVRTVEVRSLEAAMRR